MGKTKSRSYFFVLVIAILVVAVGASFLQEKKNLITEQETFETYNVQSAESIENPAQEVTGLATFPSSKGSITCLENVAPLGSNAQGVGWSDIDGLNVVYSKYDSNTQTDDIFVYNFGPDKTPNTVDDQINQITSNAPNIYVNSLKIAGRYMVYSTYTQGTNAYDAFFFDIGPTGVVGSQSIGPINLYFSGQSWINSMNVKNNVVSYIQSQPPTYQDQIFYCFADDVNRQAGTGCYAGASGIIQWTLQNAPSSFYRITNGFALGDASRLLFVYTLSTWQSGVSSEDIWIKDGQGERVLLRSINSDMFADAWLPIISGWPLFIAYSEENYCKIEEAKKGRSHTSTPIFAAIQQNSVNKYSFNQRASSPYFVSSGMKLPQRTGPFKGVPIVWSDIKPEAGMPIVRIAESGNANTFSLQGSNPSISGEGYLIFDKYGTLMITFCKSV